jgi:hypothetical protein
MRCCLSALCKYTCCLFVPFFATLPPSLFHLQSTLKWFPQMQLLLWLEISLLLILLMEMFLPFSAACKATRDFPGCLRVRLCQPATTKRERSLPCLPPQTPTSLRLSLYVLLCLSCPQTTPEFPASFSPPQSKGRSMVSFILLCLCWGGGIEEGKGIKAEHNRVESGRGEGNSLLFIHTSTSFLF